MKREFLKNLGLEDEAVDKILDEASKDIGKEKAKREQAEEDLKTVKQQLADRDKDLEELKKTSGDAAEVQKKLDDLQAKYDADTKAFQDQITARDYADAMSSAISGAGLKFSSKAAEKAFRSELMDSKAFPRGLKALSRELKEKGLTVKDGALEGFEAFVEDQKKADPEAFAPEKPAAQIVGKTGAGGDPGALSAGARAAKKFNAQYAPTKKE